MLKMNKETENQIKFKKSIKKHPLATLAAFMLGSIMLLVFGILTYAEIINWNSRTTTLFAKTGLILGLAGVCVISQRFYIYFTDRARFFREREEAEKKYKLNK